MVLQYVLRSKLGTFTGMEFSMQVSLIAKYSDRLMIVSADVLSVLPTVLIRNLYQILLLGRLVSATDAGPISGTHLVCL